MHADGEDDNEDKDIPFAEEVSLQEALLTQLSFLKLNETQYKIGEQIIGSIDEDGYLRRNIESIVNDLAFTQNIITDEDEVLSVLFKIQQFDPAGIGARNLQECLLIQLERKTDHLKEVNNAITIIEDYFEEFTKKHYDKIIQRMGIQEEDLKKALKIITKCNPKPGSGNETQAKSQFLIPDFIVVNNNGKLELSLNAKNAPELQISSSYIEMFDAYDKASKVDKKMKEAVTFVKQKLDAAKWFIDAIKQRQNTLLCTMNTILEFQKEFFLTQDESTLKPMILKDIAERINMDISTVSRVVNSKCVQTEFGIFPLKYFFSEGITTESGEDVSSKEVKNMLYQLIKEEDKSHPLGDEELEKLLKNKGYNIARRTVAKYREQLNIPVARLRKEL
jgi:RNA polymerase sigma-54 factor